MKFAKMLSVVECLNRIENAVSVVSHKLENGEVSDIEAEEMLNKTLISLELKVDATIWKQVKALTFYQPRSIKDFSVSLDIIADNLESALESMAKRSYNTY